MRFNEIGKQYKHWILQYVSSDFKCPIFFIWHLGHDGQGDRLLLNENQEVITARSPQALIEMVSKQEMMTSFDIYTAEWIQKIKETELEVSTTFYIEDLLEALRNNLMSTEVIKAMVKFLNLLSDFSDQIKDHVLESMIEKESIEKLWDFYFEEFIAQEDFSIKNVPLVKLPNLRQLSLDIQELVLSFESRLKIV